VRLQSRQSRLDKLRKGCILIVWKLKSKLVNVNGVDISGFHGNQDFPLCVGNVKILAGTFLDQKND
jgi:hypothetical protein